MSETNLTPVRRRRRSHAEADQLAAEYEVSGLGREEFCRTRGIALQTLARYRARLRRERDGGPRPEGQRWLAVEVAAPPAASSGLCLLLGSSLRVEVAAGFDVATLRRLVAALERG